MSNPFDIRELLNNSFRAKILGLHVHLPRGTTCPLYKSVPTHLCISQSSPSLMSQSNLENNASISPSSSSSPPLHSSRRSRARNNPPTSPPIAAGYKPSGQSSKYQPVRHHQCQSRIQCLDYPRWRRLARRRRLEFCFRPPSTHMQCRWTDLQSRYSV